MMRLAYTGSKDEQLRLHRQACELLDSLNASFNPINYLLAFEYFLGENKPLVEAVDLLRQGNHQWSNILGVRLKEQYLDSIAKEILSVEQELVQKINEGQLNTQEKLDEIEAYLKDLSENPSDAASISPRINRSMRFFKTMLKKHNDAVNLIQARLFDYKSKYTIDLLTRLNNELHMQFFLPKIVQVCVNDENKHIVLNLIDIEGFSYFNEANGHEVADNLLAYYGKVIKSLGSGFASWRIGADEFLIAHTIEQENDQKQEKIDELVKRLSSLAVTPKGMQKLDPLPARLVSLIFDKKLSVQSNINTLYELLDKLEK